MANAAGLLTVALVTVVTRLGAALGLLRPVMLVGTLAGLAVLAWWRISWPRGDETADARQALLSTAALPALALAALELLVVATAAAWLPVWQYDSLGYHLPFVNFVLQAGGASAGVPRDIPYLSSYPHNVETLFLALRTLLPSDALVDIGQIPLGILGAVATAGIAERLGARSEHAAIAGALWLAVPAVFLQLPTNYVDVGTAAFLLSTVYWLLGPPAPVPLLFTAIALGLFLGAKPSAVLPTLILATAMGVHARRLRRGLWLLGAAVVVAFGAESYLRNLVHTGNPWWPIKMNLGPLHLPGALRLDELLAAGANTSRPQGSFLGRIVESWTTLVGSPAFDMRKGGFGPAFLFFALPGMAFYLLHRRAASTKESPRLLFSVAMLASLASPEPSTARFVLAFPALCLAAAVACLRPLSRRLAALMGAGGVAAAGVGLVAAYPGLTGEGPPLSHYRTMTEEQRVRAVGPDGSPARWIDLRQAMTKGTHVAYDSSFTLPYLLWRSDLGNRVFALAWHLNEADLERALAENEIRYLVAGNLLPAGRWARAHPERFHELFACGADPCTVYEVR